MVYPRINTGDWIFRETFDSVSSVVENGGALTAITFPQRKKATFNGTSSFIRYPTSDVLRFTPNQITISCWITTSDTVGDVVANFETASPFVGFSYSVKGGGATDGKMALYVNDGDDSVAWVQDTGSAINDGARHHVAVTFDGSNARFYTDGVLSSTVARSAGMGISNNNLEIGRDTNTVPARYLSATLEDLRIYNLKLTDEEIELLEGIVEGANELNSLNHRLNIVNQFYLF